MKTKTVYGDALMGLEMDSVEAVVHCCNCQGVMGSGIALQIKESYPEAYTQYREQYEAEGLHLGDVQVIEVSPKKYICNIMGQEFYGYDGSKFVDYIALHSGFRKLKLELQRRGVEYIGFPYKFACDRAGGDWNIVTKMIEEILGDHFNIKYFNYDTKRMSYKSRK